MSNRDRLERLREEASLADKERSAKERKESNAGRMLAVWAIKDGMGAVVATFPYPRKADAEAEAARLREANRKTYIVAPHKIPFDG
jgi:endonuclease YncB( thermonuclease family)